MTMTDMDCYVSALQDMSAQLLTIAATENSRGSDMLRAHARDLDQIAFELLVEEEIEASTLSR